MDDIEVIIYLFSSILIFSFFFFTIFFFLILILLKILSRLLKDKSFHYYIILYIQIFLNKKYALKIILISLISYLVLFHVFAFNFGLYFFTTGYIFIFILFFLIYCTGELSIIILNVDNQNQINFRLLVSSLFFSFLIAEFLIQITGKYDTIYEKRNKLIYTSFFKSQDRNWYHVLMPNSKITIKNYEYCYSRTTNSLGLSDIEPKVSKRPDEFRIIGLGDSFTEGDGAPYDSTWIKTLENNIHKYKSCSNFSFINAGVRGSDPYYQYILLKNKLLKYLPDLVIVTINSNDIDDIIIKGGIERFTKEFNVQFKHKPGWLWFYESTHISRLFIHSLFKYNYLLLKPEEMAFETMKSVELIYKIVLMFGTLSKENNFKLLIVFHPFKTEIYNGHYDYLEPLISKLKNQEPDLNILDILDYFKKFEKIDKFNYSKYFWKIDGHHNSHGYCAFSRGVENKLCEMGIIKN
jgi:hypothetical protein